MRLVRSALQTSGVDHAQTTHKSKSDHKRVALIAVALVASLISTSTGRLARVQAESRQEALSITPNFEPSQNVPSAQPIELQFNRFPEKAEGRIDVFISSSDLPSLLTRTANNLA